MYFERKSSFVFPLTFAIFLVSFETIWELDSSSGDVTEVQVQGNINITMNLYFIEALYVILFEETYFSQDSELWTELQYKNEFVTYLGLLNSEPILLPVLLACLWRPFEDFSAAESARSACS